MAATRTARRKRLISTLRVAVFVTLAATLSTAGCDCNQQPIPRPDVQSDADAGDDVEDTADIGDDGDDDTGTEDAEDADDTGMEDADATGDVEPDANGGGEGWAKAYVSSGTGYEEPADIITTSDGGLLVCGQHSDDVRGYDAWLVKLDADGNVDWERAFGGDNTDRCTRAIETDDGGYLAVGVEYSSEAEPPSNGWVVKVDSVGTIDWERYYGGTEAEWFRDVVSNDAGYLLVGNTASYGQGGGCGMIGCNDMFVVQIDDVGDVQWARTYGGADAHDYAHAVVKRSETRYVIAGRTAAFGAGGNDGLVVEIDETGAIQWQKTYGTPQNDGINALALDADGSLVVGGRFATQERGEDIWVARLDSSGEFVWQTVMGDENDEALSDLLIADDGGIVYSGDDPLASAGRVSVVGKLDMDGGFDWRRHFGLNLDFEQNWGYAVTETASHYVVAAVTNWVQASNGDLMLAAFDPSTGELGCGIDSAFDPTVEDGTHVAQDVETVVSEPTVATGMLEPTELEPSKTTDELCP